jgi:hypothetical protein
MTYTHLIAAVDVKVGDSVCFPNPKLNYKVDSTELTFMGQVTHRFNNETEFIVWNPGTKLNIQRNEQ